MNTRGLLCPLPTRRRGLILVQHVYYYYAKAHGGRGARLCHAALCDSPFFNRRPGPADMARRVCFAFMEPPGTRASVRPCRPPARRLCGSFTCKYARSVRLNVYGLVPAGGSKLSRAGAHGLRVSVCVCAVLCCRGLGVTPLSRGC